MKGKYLFDDLMLKVIIFLREEGNLKNDWLILALMDKSLFAFFKDQLPREE